MRKRCIVKSPDDERGMLEELVTKGRAAAQKPLHARILLKADASPEGPSWVNAAIGEALDVSRATIERVRRRWVEEGVAVALSRRPGPPRRPRKFFGEQAGRLVALACSAPPAGHARWSLRLLAARLVELEYIEAVSHDTVWRTLKRNELKPWLKEQW